MSREWDGELVSTRADPRRSRPSNGIATLAPPPGQHKGAERSHTFERLSLYLSRVLQLPILTVSRELYELGSLR